MFVYWMFLIYQFWCSVPTATAEPYVSGNFMTLVETTTKKPVGAMMDAASVALQFVENVRTAASCDGGTSNTLNVVFDNSEWKAQANAAVRLSNLLTHWFMINGSGADMTDELLFAMTRTTIEIETLAFGSAIAFEPGLYRNMDKFCAYSFHTGNTTIKSHDISVEYDYFPSEWYLGCKQKFLNNTNVLKDNVTLRLSGYNSNGTKVHKIPVTFPEPRMEYDDGFWTRPYFDCGGGDIWMITFNSPVLAVLNSSLTFAGVATVDIALNILDIDQCDATSDAKKIALNVFRGTHHCKPSSTCVPKTGLGFRRGTYQCTCRPGYYFPNASSSTKAFSGFDVEDAYAAWVMNGSAEYFNYYDCLPCPEGCETCTDSTPCLADWNWVIRSVLLAVVVMMLVCVHFIALLVTKHQKRTIIKSASPMFLLIICLGGIVITISGILEFPKVTHEICIARVWFQHLGFVLIYGPLLLKNWRYETEFKRRKDCLLL
ncbi:hypothetical protein RvY_13368 [Ramazzottius varieornatus]|uniref:Uncharacterized protein n=1 Tax=Ramazzottius varieornatus TaxID=947166 RepID=A0A1D1VV42_RAMVA|nr:hypothetical protein RvY_13368 [Ramazzottius varieornatus]